MTKGNDGWYDRSGQGQTEVRITNWLYFPDGAIYYPDRATTLLALQPDSDVWVVISDDPNVTGDISWEVSYTNPDESSPKTSDDIDGSFALLLMCVSTAAICAMIFIYRPRFIQH